MNASCKLAAMAALAIAWGAVQARAQAVPPPPPVPGDLTPSGAAQPIAPTPDATPGMEVLTRGPVHEAYAEPVVNQRSAGLVVPRQPPAAIEELPPDARPEGENIVWMPGYWAWDQDRNDFIWVSGIWRATPPGLQWLPGYWAQVDNGWQWVSGTWVGTQVQTVDYFSEPPAPVEAAVPPQPGDNYFYIPGIWRWRDGRYAWRAGYWAPQQADWIWVPARYVWTPRGWLFVDGYWDYPLANRGLLFCPVYYAQPLYLRPAYAFRPVFTVGLGILTFHLFAWPHYGHYYFGDYYAASYATAGIVPWYMFHERHLGYDPLWTYYSWHYHQTDPTWSAHLKQWYGYYQAHPDMRPPHTMAAQLALRGHTAGRLDADKLVVGQSLHDLRAHPNGPIRLASVSPAETRRIEQSVHDFRKFDAQRHDLELKATAAGARTGHGPAQPESLQLSNLKGHAALTRQLPGTAAEVHRSTSVTAGGGTAGRPSGFDANRRSELSKVPGGNVPGGAATPGNNIPSGNNLRPSRPDVRPSTPPGNTARTFSGVTPGSTATGPSFPPSPPRVERNVAPTTPRFTPPSNNSSPQPRSTAPPPQPRPNPPANSGTSGNSNRDKDKKN